MNNYTIKVYEIVDEPRDWKAGESFAQRGLVKAAEIDIRNVLTPQDAVMAWGEQLRAEEAS